MQGLCLPGLTMDDTTRGIIERITVRYAEPTKIRSGHICSVYYDCIQLTPSELARLGAEAVGDLPEQTFDMALGVAYHGIFFAAAIAAGKNVAILGTDGKIYGPEIKGKKLLIVDDVACSGKRLLEAEQAAVKAGAVVAGFACIVDRSEGQAALGKPLWSAYQTGLV